MEVGLKKTKPAQVAVVSHIGPYSAAPKLYEEIVKWLRKKQLRITGPPFGSFYDNPEEVPANKLKSELGFPFKGEAESEGNVKIRRIPAQDVLSTIYKGPYREVGSSCAALLQYAKEKGYVPLGCPMEIYLNDPAKVAEDQLLTEIQVPVKKK